MDKDAKVYKKIGPVLAKQDLEEAKSNVGKRIEYLTSESKRQETLLKDLDKKQDSQREIISKLQQQFQQQQQKLVKK